MLTVIKQGTGGSFVWVYINPLRYGVNKKVVLTNKPADFLK